MKIVGVTLLSVLILVVLASVSIHQEKARREKDLRETGERIAELKVRAEALLVSTRKEYVRVKFGERTAVLYGLCIDSPPTVKSHQETCNAILKKVSDAEAREEKW